MSEAELIKWCDVDRLTTVLNNLFLNIVAVLSRKGAYYHISDQQALINKANFKSNAEKCFASANNLVNHSTRPRELKEARNFAYLQITCK